MNMELISVLEHLEREKGVSRSVLIEAIETALVSAAKKILKEKETEVEAKIDQETGDIAVFSDGERIKSSEFGRIAAQTAKQVIIQKIRDAERDVVFEEFEPKLNHLVSGTVFRYEKGAVIVDLGKTEAVLPKREQSQRDVYRQGDRIRVYILEVNREQKGPQIIVSRNHPNLVKRLFEMEVPEVMDAIVEIRSIAREAGDRSKIAVWSKDEKVDCVGACVGMRGQRVKNIVRELQGEKIDIVRWKDNVVEYVREALSPAECQGVQIKNEEEKQIEVVVEEDQLSLAIGKNGQNVRLASKLLGWNIEISSKAALDNAEADRMKKEAGEGLEGEEAAGEGAAEQQVEGGAEETEQAEKSAEDKKSDADAKLMKSVKANLLSKDEAPQEEKVPEPETPAKVEVAESAQEAEVEQNVSGSDKAVEKEDEAVAEEDEAVVDDESADTQETAIEEVPAAAEEPADDDRNKQQSENEQTELKEDENAPDEEKRESESAG